MTKSDTMLLEGSRIFLLICVFWPNVIAQSFPPPDILDCPKNILHAVAYDENSVTVTWQEPTSDPVVTPSKSHSPGSRFNVGKTPVRYTFTSSLGESANCDFTVEVKRIDTKAPVVMQCPRGVSAPISPTESSVPVEWREPYATDNTGTDVKTTKTHSPGDSFGRGFTMVNYTFEDTSGNVNSCSFTVTVYLVDNIHPVIENCPSDITREVENHNVFEAVSWTEPSASDETSQGADLEIYRSHSSGDRFRAGVTNVLYVFADESQNIVNCTFQIHLDPPISPKVSSCPRSRVEVVENNDPEPTSQESQSPQFLTEGVSFPEQTSPVSPWNRTFVQVQLDQLTTNREIICSYDVYFYRVDTIAPDINDCQSRKQTTTATLALKGWSGSVTAPMGDFTASYSPDATGSFIFPEGETVVAILLEDTSKNTRVCSVSVTVNPAIKKCPNRISGESKTKENSLEVYWPNPVSEIVGVSTDPIALPPGSLFMLGSTTVQITFTDVAGRREICEFEVFVTEENPLRLSSCPDDIVKMLPSDSDSVTVTWALPDADNKLGSDFNVIGLNATHNSGDTFSVGNTTVVYVFQDEDDPKFLIDCTFVVSVKDEIPPVIENCPVEVRLSVLAWYGTFNWKEEIMYTDNSGVTKEFSSHDSNFQYPLGETTVTLRIVDSSGNEEVCSYPVIVALILPEPVLIVIAVFILLFFVIIIICYCRYRCRCRTARSRKRDGATQQGQGDQNSKGTSDSFPKGGNNYSNSVEMDHLGQQNPISSSNNEGEYVYVDETAPPVPNTPRPVLGQTPSYVNDNVDGSLNTFPRKKPKNEMKKLITVETPDKIDEDQGYLKPSDSHQYTDNISNLPNEYSYAYDHTNQGRI